MTSKVAMGNQESRDTPIASDIPTDPHNNLCTPPMQECLSQPHDYGLLGRNMPINHNKEVPHDLNGCHGQPLNTGDASDMPTDPHKNLRTPLMHDYLSQLHDQVYQGPQTTIKRHHMTSNVAMGNQGRSHRPSQQPPHIPMQEYIKAKQHPQTTQMRWYMTSKVSMGNKESRGHAHRPNTYNKHLIKTTYYGQGFLRAPRPTTTTYMSYNIKANPMKQRDTCTVIDKPTGLIAITQ